MKKKSSYDDMQEWWAIIYTLAVVAWHLLNDKIRGA